MVAVLLLAGLTRSMQFTALNTLAFADITAAQRSSSSTLASMLMQITSVLGVALGSFLLKITQTFYERTQSLPIDFQLAFMVTGIMVLTSTLIYLKLPRDAGAEVSGHRG
jgi:hypothetical protein